MFDFENIIKDILNKNDAEIRRAFEAKGADIREIVPAVAIMEVVNGFEHDMAFAVICACIGIVNEKLDEPIEDTLARVIANVLKNHTKEVNYGA